MTNGSDASPPGSPDSDPEDPVPVGPAIQKATVDAAGLVTGDDGLNRPAWAAADPMLRGYYDHEWGLPVEGETAHFERLSLEAFQAGLSWSTILRKRDAFRDAFDGFDVDRVAAYPDSRLERLMEDERIVRNRRKIEATRSNARATIALREQGGLERMIWSFQPEVTPAPHSPVEIPTESPESVALAGALRERGFVFVGPTSMFALMEAIGVVDTHLLGSHRRGSSGIWPA